MVYHFIYTRPIEVVIHAVIVLLLIFAVFDRLLSQFRIFKRLRQTVYVLIFLAALMGIWYCTLGNRGAHSEMEIRLIPLDTFRLAKVQPEYYRSMFMNALLFFPLGVSVSYLITKFSICQFLYTAIFGYLVSLICEFAQFGFHLGIFEIDDIIMNSLGTVVGAVATVTLRSIILFVLPINKKRVRSQL